MLDHALRIGSQGACRQPERPGSDGSDSALLYCGPGHAAHDRSTLDRRLLQGTDLARTQVEGGSHRWRSVLLSIGNQQSANLPVVAPKIAEALIATAIGLVAAIPAVMAYNYFSRRVGELADIMDAFASDVSARAKLGGV